MEQAQIGPRLWAANTRSALEEENLSVPFETAAAWGLAIGSSLVAGAIVAATLEIPDRAAAAISAFGGGILLAAVAFELVPEADERAGPGLTAMALVGGTVIYLGADALLTRNKKHRSVRRKGHAAAAGRDVEMMIDEDETIRGELIAAGLFVDGIPESMAFGLTVSEKAIGVALLVGILVGNLVEAYGAAQPIIHGGHSKRFAIALLGAIGITLAGATILGATILAGTSPEVIGGAQAIAAGAVLAVVSISIIPHAFAEVNAWVAFYAVIGFVAGYVLG